MTTRNGKVFSQFHLGSNKHTSDFMLTTSTHPDQHFLNAAQQFWRKPNIFLTRK